VLGLLELTKDISVSESGKSTHDIPVVPLLGNGDLPQPNRTKETMLYYYYGLDFEWFD